MSAHASDWLIENLDLIVREEAVLDVASGRGRHALYLARRGWQVVAIDRDPAALSSLDSQCRALGCAITTRVLDLEQDGVDLGVERYGTILVFNYLYRPLVPQLVRALKAGGVLLYETFRVGQEKRGHPRNPAFLLAAGELPALVAPLVPVRSREGDINGKLIASIAAR